MPWLKAWVKGENANLLINKTTPAPAHCFPSSFPSPPERALSPQGCYPVQVSFMYPPIQALTLTWPLDSHPGVHSQKHFMATGRLRASSPLLEIKGHQSILGSSPKESRP